MKDLDVNCSSNDDFLYMVYLLMADDKKEQVKKELREAYNSLEGACREVEYNAGFGIKMLEDIKWYTHITERDIYSHIDDIVYKVKTQIAGREILKHPKLSSIAINGLHK